MKIALRVAIAKGEIRSTGFQHATHSNLSKRPTTITFRCQVIKMQNGQPIDDFDEKQQIDIERLINLVHHLQDKTEQLEGEISQGERRDRDRLVVLRSIIRESIKQAISSSSVSSHIEDSSMQKITAAYDAVTQESDKTWDSYRDSFTLLMSKGYLATTDQLRDKLMAFQWELGLRAMALQIGVARFESYCAQNKSNITYETLTALHDDPTYLDVIQDPHLRMQARAIISQVEAEQRIACYQACTVEAQKLAQQFSEGEFISKMLPDPIEHGVVDSLRKVIIPMSKLMGGGNA